MPSQAMEMTKTVMKQMAEQGVSLKFDGDIDVGRMRAVMGAAQSRMPTDPGVTFEPCTLNGVETELNVPENARADAVIVYYHGGGFVVGNTLTSRGYASVLANETRIPVYTVSYRLAPEYPYPAGVDDCFAVYQAVIKKHPGLPVFIIGESAGAYLSIVMVLKARDAGIPSPAGVILYSPPLEMWGLLDRHHANNKDFTITPEGVAVMGQLYGSGGELKNDPYVTPLIADYTAFPPTYLVWDESESLAVDAGVLRDKLQAAGCDVTAEGYPDCFHAFATSGRGTPESAEVLKKTVEFIDRHSRNTLCQ